MRAAITTEGRFTPLHTLFHADIAAIIYIRHCACRRLRRDTPYAIRYNIADAYAIADIELPLSPLCRHTLGAAWGHAGALPLSPRCHILIHIELGHIGR